MNALVTGAGGFIGHALVRRLAAAGWNVTAGVHTRPVLVPGVRSIPLALGQPIPAQALANVDVVYHLAHDLAPGSGARTVAGTKRWLDAARDRGVPRQVYVTSYSAHGTAPSEYGRSKFELEEYAASVGAVLVRPGLVVGNGGVFGALAALVRRLPLVPVPGGDLPVYLTALGDLLTVFDRSDPRDAARCLNVFAAEPMPLADVVRVLAESLGRRQPVLSVPSTIALPLLRAAGVLNGGMARQAESLAALAASQAFGHRSDAAELGIAVESTHDYLRRAIAAFSD